ncbi:MAG: hypothetical protein EZS28_050734, partial [Streblomastix strix]
CVVRFSNISVREIKKSDLIGKPDPYVIFKYGKESKKTSVGKNTINYDYQDEEYELEFDPTKTEGKHDIDIEVYDHDSFSMKDLVGNVSVDVLPSLNQQQEIEVYLQPKKKKKEDLTKSKTELTPTNADQKLGKVSFNMLYISEQELTKNREFKEKQKIEDEQQRLEEEKRNAELKRKEKEALDAQYIKGVVQFKNISVSNLKKMDVFSKNDPFVLFKAGESTQQTTTAKNILNYQYLNESYEVVYDPAVMQGKHEIEVEVYDQDSLTKNDLIGAVNVDV